MTKKKAPATGAQKIGDRSSKEYAKLAGLAGKMFPAWNPETLRATVHSILVMARPAAVESGVMDSACSWIPGAGVIQLHFDGKGGVKINPDSDCTPELLDLGRALRFVLGDKLTVGKPEVFQ